MVAHRHEVQHAALQPVRCKGRSEYRPPLVIPCPRRARRAQHRLRRSPSAPAGHTRNSRSLRKSYDSKAATSSEMAWSPWPEGSGMATGAACACSDAGMDMMDGVEGRETRLEMGGS